MGELRFRPPEPVEPWDGAYDATRFGPSSWQLFAQGMVGALPDATYDEDCLFLNVYTPAADGERRPVMVWIHGGAYIIGSGDLYNGASFCTRGDVVVVTLNYRLGALGWLSLEHLDPSLAGSGNTGLRDQIEALRWVRDNIEAFGGDPDNVTIFGESAGGGSVLALLAAPDADGLYRRAIVESGAGGFGPVCKPDVAVRELLAALGADPADDPLAVLRAAPPDQLAAAGIASIGALGTLGTDADHALDGSGIGFHPVVDGVVIHDRVWDAVAKKGGDAAPLLAGWNRDEGTLFMAVLPQVDDDALALSISRATANPEKVVAAVRARNTGRHPVIDLMTEAVFKYPTMRVLDALTANGVPAYAYEFTWETPVFGGLLKASHAVEIPFAWNDLDGPNWRLLVGDNPPRDLALAMHDAWIAFARGGSPQHAGIPEWPTYDLERRPTMEFGEHVRVVDDPGADVRTAW